MCSPGSGFCLTLVVIAMTGCASQTSSGVSPALPPAPTTIVEQADSLVTASGTIAGTVELPAHAFPVPVVLIIAGSGPTDRDGNTPALPGKNNSLKYLAAGLAERGIATVRYDKRGIAASAKAAGAEQDLRFTNYIDDAKAWVEKLRLDPRFSTVTIAGHSEGSLIGVVAANEGLADAYVSLAGAGRKPREIIIEQLTGQLPPETVNEAKSMLIQLEEGTIPDSSVKVSPILFSLFRPSVRPYLASWFKYDPAVEIAKLTVPALIVQGTTDIQISMTDANALAAAYPAGHLFVVEGMNHVLKEAPAGRAAQGPAYSDPAIPVVPKLLDEMATFIKGVRLRGR